MADSRKSTDNRAQDSVAGLRFLVVDDHKFSRHITIEALKWLNATRIVEAADASEAIALLKGASANDRKSAASSELARRLELSDDRLFGQGKFDCIVTDFNMTPLNGLHLLKAIRTGDAGCARDTPVLLLTGFSDDHLIASALNLDVNAFVLKPISRVAFNEKLSRVLMRPITLQPPEAYGAVDISDPVELAVEKPASDTVKTEHGSDFKPGSRQLVDVPVADLARMSADTELMLGEEITLGQDAAGPDGVVYLHRGTILTPLLVEKLSELQSIGRLPEQLKVYK